MTSSSGVDEMDDKNYILMECGYWTYYRRSSSEPTTSLDSFNAFADDEGTSGNSSFNFMARALPVESCCHVRARYIISFLLLLVVVVLCTLLFLAISNGISVASQIVWLRSNN